MQPYQPEELLQELDQQHIPYELFHHPPLHTVEDALRLRSNLDGSYVKNLYLRDRKGEMILIVCHHLRTVHLQRLRKALGYKRLSFASTEQLWNDLGVRPGSVSPLALINAVSGSLRFFADQDLQQNTLTNFHPLTNEMTVQIGLKDWVSLCTLWGFPPVWIDFDQLSKEA